MKRRDNNDSSSLRYKICGVLMRIMVVLVAAIGLSGWSCRGPQPARLAGDRLVLASRAMNNRIDIRMSIDGQVWTEPIQVLLNGTPAQTSSTPSIFYDGTLYHLYWADQGNIRYATSHNGTQWLGQADPLSRSPAPLSVARSASKVLGVLRSNNGITALDLASSTAQRSTVTQSVGSVATVPASITHGNGKFVVAVVNSNGNAEIFQSNDNGASWSSISILPAPNLFWVQLNHAGGQFLLAAKQLPAVCNVFTSPDAISWTEVPVSGCTNSSTGILATRVQNETIFLENWDNRFLRASRNSGSLSDTHITGVNGQFTITTGRGPQIASLRFNQVRVNQGTRQDLTIVALGFRARTGVANSAHVTFAGRFEEFEHDVNAGETVSVPLHVSPFAWLIERAGTLNDDGNLDIVGAVIVGIDRGACPEGPIVDRINRVRSALEQELEAKISRGRLADLKDPASRQRVLNELQDAVKRRLGGSPNNLFEDIGTDIVCGFNQDEQFKEKVIVLVGSDLVPDDTQRGVFNFLSWNQNTSVTLTSNDNSKSWTIEASSLLLAQ